MTLVRLLATSDLHMQLTAWDYSKDRALRRGELERLAPLVEDARAEARRQGGICLLFDNGDALQGSVLGEVEAGQADRTTSHALMDAFRRLGYDAIGLGNHDFDFGLEFLSRCLRSAPCPVLCANLQRLDGVPFPEIERAAILWRTIGTEQLKIGVLAAAPPQTAQWNADKLAGRVAFGDLTTAVAAQSARLRDAGCDLVVVLAHTGIGDKEHRHGQENAILPILNVGGVDAVFGGHTHLPYAGKLAGSRVPVAQAAAFGRQLAQIDLTLQQAAGGGWKITAAKTALLEPPVAQPDPAASRLGPMTVDLHRRTQSHMREPVGATGTALHSYFSLLRPDAHLHLIAEAQFATVRHLFSGQALPVLSAVAPGKHGGRGGADNFTEIPPGPVYRRHIVDMLPFPNALRAVVLSGRAILDWLEMSASRFRRIDPGQPAAPLLHPDWPANGFDSLFGLRYEIDVSQPARYRPDGSLVAAENQRIRNVTCSGQPIRPEQEFIVLLTDYRANGGGNVAALDTACRFPVPDIMVRDALTAALRSPPRPEYKPEPWAFASLSGTRVRCQTGPGARRYLRDLARFSARVAEIQPDGFLELDLQLLEPDLKLIEWVQ